jgi:UBX domain-containing protein 1
MARPGGDDAPVPQSHFAGRGVTLGGDDAPSRVVQDNAPPAPRQRERVQQVLHLWQDGFSIDDGDLYRYDDPQNAAALALIHSGRAPLELLNVEPGQEVNLQIDLKKETKFVKPKLKYKPFSGSGYRLGSPVPGSSSGTVEPTTTAAPAAASTAQASSAAEAPAVAVSDSTPTISLQIRLGDGTRLQSRFNTTHTVGDVYGFVDSASPASRQRPYALMTTFPSKELADKSAVLGDLAEFKRGGVVVQKWAT